MKWKQTTFSARPKAIYDILTDADFLVARSEQNGEENVSASVDKKKDKRVVSMHAERAMKLPAFVKKLYEPHQSIDITETWEKEGDEYVGYAEYIPVDRPLKILTETRILADKKGTAMRIGVAVEASIPLIGGRVEKFVANQFVVGIDSSFDYLRDHLEE